MCGSPQAEAAGGAGSAGGAGGARTSGRCWEEQVEPKERVAAGRVEQVEPEERAALGGASGGSRWSRRRWKWNGVTVGKVEQ